MAWNPECEWMYDQRVGIDGVVYNGWRRPRTMPRRPTFLVRDVSLDVHQNLGIGTHLIKPVGVNWGSVFELVRGWCRDQQVLTLVTQEEYQELLDLRADAESRGLKKRPTEEEKISRMMAL